MKLKKFFAFMLVFVTIVSCFGVSVSAVGDVPDKDKPFMIVRASGRFNMEVPGNTTVKADSSFPLEVGEVVTIKATYSPFSASVDFGLIAPDGLFYGLNTTTGSFDEAIEVNQRGHYYFAVRNNSSETISTSGYVNY